MVMATTPIDRPVRRIGRRVGGQINSVHTCGSER